MKKWKMLMGITLIAVCLIAITALRLQQIYLSESVHAKIGSINSNRYEFTYEIPLHVLVYLNIVNGHGESIRRTDYNITVTLFLNVTALYYDRNTLEVIETKNHLVNRTLTLTYETDYNNPLTRHDPYWEFEDIRLEWLSLDTYPITRSPQIFIEAWLNDGEKVRG